MEDKYGSLRRSLILYNEVVILGHALLEEEIAGMLDVSTKTVQRYCQQINEAFAANGEEPIIQIDRSDRGKKYYAKPSWSVNGTHYHIVSLYFGTALMNFLNETIVKDSIEEISQNLKQKLTREQKKVLRSLPKKIYSTSFGLKKYNKYDDVIDAIIWALFAERKFEMKYKSLRKSGVYTISPYTLVSHREALYVAGFSDEHGEMRIFSVDRIKGIRKLTDKFEYPSNYDPEAIFKKSFGIFVGHDVKGIKIEIEFNECVHDYVSHRKWINGQITTPVKDGKFRMKAEVSDLFEISHWVLGLGQEARVIRPKKLLDWITTEIKTMQRLYRKS
jgi:predicted DNA-binding transcriptional regulator YafY